MYMTLSMQSNAFKRSCSQKCIKFITIVNSFFKILHHLRKAMLSTIFFKTNVSWETIQTQNVSRQSCLYISFSHNLETFESMLSGLQFVSFGSLSTCFRQSQSSRGHYKFSDMNGAIIFLFSLVFLVGISLFDKLLLYSNYQ